MTRQRQPRRCFLGLACLAVLAGTLLAGCGGGPYEPPPPPIFRVDEIWYWFEGEILIFNVTITNQANFTPGIDTLYPEMGLFVSDWLAKEKPGREPGDDLYVASGKGRQGAHLGLHPFSRYDWQERWYDQEARDRLGLPYQLALYGPIKLAPGDSISPEFGFVPDHNLTGENGYYAMDFHLTAFYPRGWHNSSFGGLRLQLGCFNRDIDEFYGVSMTGPDCWYYDETGRDTASGMTIFGAEHVGVPTMKRGPPPGHW